MPVHLYLSSYRAQISVQKISALKEIYIRVQFTFFCSLKKFELFKLAKYAKYKLISVLASRQIHLINLSLLRGCGLHTLTYTSR